MVEPRATRIHVCDLPHLTTELWMGGAYSPNGEPLLPDDLAGTWVIDCAGEMPEPYRAAAAWWLTDVFQDYEQLPASWERLVSLAESVSRCLLRLHDGHPAEHPPEPPTRLYVLCNQGMNRSGLMMGLILRRLGLTSEEALRSITFHRPGALSNLTFARLVREH